MSNLSNYSIETDHTVLLWFKDGRKRRVRLEHLSKYLAGPDLETIRKSLDLRRHFLRHHMPRMVVVLAAMGGLLALLTVGGKTVASLLGHPKAPAQAPSSTGIARSQELPSPALSSDPQQPAASSSKLTAYRPHHAAANSGKNSSQASVPTVTAVPRVVLPAPVATPLPDASGQLPLPVPSPIPSPLPSAAPTDPAAPAPAVPQVLSDSTTSPATP